MQASKETARVIGQQFDNMSAIIDANLDAALPHIDKNNRAFDHDFNSIEVTKGKQTLSFVA